MKRYDRGDLMGKGYSLNWPFKKMSLGEEICFTSDMSAKAQAYCHAFGRTCGMAFSTKRNLNGELCVRRIL